MNTRVIRLVAIIALAVVLYFWKGREGFEVQPSDGPATTAERTEEPSKQKTAGRRVDDANKIVQAFRAKREGVMVTSYGTVVKVLPDDNDGSRHQRFIVKLSNGHTILIAHNIDLAPRVPKLRKGHDITFKGQFEWNDRGGVVHWTHHDPAKRHPGGWLELEGKRYE